MCKVLWSPCAQLAVHELVLAGRCRYCPLANAPVNETATPGCSLFINDTFYDNVSVRYALPVGELERACLGCI